MMLRWQDSYISTMTYKPSKAGETDSFSFVIRVHQLGLFVHDYKSLHAAVKICATLVNTQTYSFCPVIYY